MQDGSPGFTDQPWRDIQAHESNANMAGHLGTLFFFGTIMVAPTMNQPFLYGIGGIAASLLFRNAAHSWNLQAQKWKSELLYGELKDLKEQVNDIETVMHMRGLQHPDAVATTWEELEEKHEELPEGSVILFDERGEQDDGEV